MLILDLDTVEEALVLTHALQGVVAHSRTWAGGYWGRSGKRRNAAVARTLLRRLLLRATVAGVPYHIEQGEIVWDK